MLFAEQSHRLNSMLLSDSPVDLATATNSPRPKKREQASAAFPFDRVIVEPFTFSDSAILENRASTYLTKIVIAERLELKGALLRLSTLE